MAPTVRIVLLLVISSCLVALCQGCKTSLAYSLDGKVYNVFGSLKVVQTSDGNFTGFLEPHKNLGKSLAVELKETVKTNPKALYYIQAGPLLTSNFACALLKANLAHDFAVTIDHERGEFLSITVYPKDIYDVGAEEFDCSEESILETYKPKFASNVIVTNVKDLLSPETAAYLTRIEEEKRARQHGATQDNRGFLAKYWMYIVPLALFMIVSSVMTGDESNYNFSPMDRISSHGTTIGNGSSTAPPMYAHTSSPAPQQQYSVIPLAGGSTGYQTEPSMPGPSTVAPGQSPSIVENQLGGASMNKLTEVFMTASFAFQRLGDITMQITASAGNPDEMKWSEKDAERLTQAIKQFADECDKIHTDVRSRTGQMIKTDFKRRTIQVNQQNAANSLINNYNPNGRSPGSGASTSYAIPMSHYNGITTTLNSVASTTSTGSYTLTAQKRPGTIIVGGPTKRIVSSSGGTTFRTISSSALTGPSGLRGTGSVIRPMGSGTHLRLVQTTTQAENSSYSGHRLVPANRQLPANQYYEQLDGGASGGTTTAINQQLANSPRSTSVASNASGSGGPSSSAPIL